MLCQYLQDDGCQLIYMLTGEWRHLPINVCNENCNPEEIKAKIKAATKGKKPPPISERIKNITLAGGRVVEAFAQGKKLIVNRTERIRRLDICKKCEYSSIKFRGDVGCKGCKKKNNKKEGRWCSKCGCWLKAKIKLATEDCPMGFWG